MPVTLGPLMDTVLLGAITGLGLGCCWLVANLGRWSLYSGRGAVAVVVGLSLALCLTIVLGLAPPYLLWVGLILAWLLGWLLSHPRVAHWSGQEGLVATRRYAGAAALMVVGAGILLAIASTVATDEKRGAQPEQHASAGAPRRVEPWVAASDLGSAITLYPCTTEQVPAFSVAKEAEFIRKANLEFQVIQVALPSTAANCHGWVFTGGQFAVSGELVERLLSENGYAEVPYPQAGDLVVYRGSPGSGDIIHTGLVRVAAPDGLVLIESKWSSFGRFLHRPEHQPFSQHWKFYRSSRKGHLLRNLPQSPDEVPSLSPRRSV